MPPFRPESRADRILRMALDLYVLHPRSKVPQRDDQGDVMWLALIRTPEWAMCYDIALKVVEIQDDHGQGEQL